MSNALRPIEVFLSYAPEDESLCQELEKHLSLLKRGGLITTGHKGGLVAGSDTKVLDQYLGRASVVLLLLSADFVASDYCYGIEMKRAMARHEAGEACVIPILLRPMVQWQSTPFSKLTVLPSNGRPITEWRSRDAAFADVAQGVMTIVEGRSFTIEGTTFVPSSSPATEPTRGSKASTVSSPVDIWNVPYARNPYFTGQEEVLTQLTEAFKKNQLTARSELQAISGLGGIGKTQIAIEYAYEHRQEYRQVLWVQADTHEALVSGYVAIAGLLKLREKDKQDQTPIVQAVLDWFKTHSEWLLILDNADDLTIVREFIPPVFGGHILLTTRALSMGRLASSREVSVMQQSTGALLLLRRAGLIRRDASLNAALPSDIETACTITEELGGLPLALDQAGAYLEETQCSLADYLNLYRTQRGEMLKERGGLVNDHPEPVATTWLLSFQKVEQANPGGADLLRFCAFLHPDAIPAEELISAGVEQLGPLLQGLARNPLALNRAIAALGAYSLLRRDKVSKTLSVHRLVQAVLKDALTKSVQLDWAERVVYTVNAAFPAVQFTAWQQCERYLPHAQVCVQLIAEYNLLFPEAARLLTRMAWYLKERARYQEAEPVLRQALAINTHCTEASGGDTAQILNVLAGMYEEQGHYAKAESLYQRALALYEQLLGSEHLYTVRCLNNLAGLYNRQGRYQEAEALYLRALAIGEQLLEPAALDTATMLHNLAYCYEDQGHYARAEPLMERALTIYEQLLGSDDPHTITCLNNLAELYCQQKKYATAEPLYQRALATSKQVFGLSHPATADSLNNLASLYFQQGEYTDAHALYLQALAMYEQHLGPDHPSIASSLSNLAGVACEQGEYTEAEALLKRAIKIDGQQPVPDHPEAAMSLHNLARLYHRWGRYMDAEPLYQQALSIRVQRLGWDHPYTLDTIQKYSDLLRKMGRGTEADNLHPPS